MIVIVFDLIVGVSLAPPWAYIGCRSNASHDHPDTKVKIG
jgi:hypothetical protein